MFWRLHVTQPFNMVSVDCQKQYFLLMVPQQKQDGSSEFLSTGTEEVEAVKRSNNFFSMSKFLRHIRKQGHQRFKNYVLDVLKHIFAHNPAIIYGK